MTTKEQKQILENKVVSVINDHIIHYGQFSGVEMLMLRIHKIFVDTTEQSYNMESKTFEEKVREIQKEFTYRSSADPTGSTDEFSTVKDPNELFDQILEAHAEEMREKDTDELAKKLNTIIENCSDLDWWITPEADVYYLRIIDITLNKGGDCLRRIEGNSIFEVLDKALNDKDLKEIIDKKIGGEK